MKKLMGPPEPGPVVRIVGSGIDVYIKINDDLDAAIVDEVLRLANRRRYGKTI